MTRGFEVVSKYQALDLPSRATTRAAGYDFQAAVDFKLPSIWKLGFLKVLWALKHENEVDADDLVKAQKIIKPLLIPTGIKAYMDENEYLMIANRSSNPLKRSLILPNGVGIIDADYYNNSSNEGEIFVQMINWGLTDITVKKGERIGQGIFMPFLLADGDADTAKQERTSGFGSTGIN
ncbi:dUTP diphosphatase [Periweissella cryptocerci]|uniref:dUTP diphosphatase n=1 Tax=Periweissella cryptocerci TaxID=2506420 RepID=A0A4P6YSX7_9LACO|nr:dUTP diphosphatase [Periweissella cryptocerci]QBO35834.1 dUTP diphosphatase [Periweissella cryptocerci]